MTSSGSIYIGGIPRVHFQSPSKFPHPPSLFPGDGGWTHPSSVWGDMHAGLFDWGVLGPLAGSVLRVEERAACIGMSSSAIAQAQKWCLWHDIRVRFRHVVCDYIACGRCLPFMRCMRPRWFSWGVRAQADSDT